MLATLLLRALAVWVAIAVAEIVHGGLRVRLLNPRVGDHRARQMGVLTGSLIILAVAWLTVPWIGPTAPGEALAVGAVWTAAMLAFEVYFGRVVFQIPLKQVAADFDLRQGGLLGFGMVILFLSPLLVGRLRGLL